MTEKKTTHRRTVLMTSGLTASAAVIAFTVAAAPNTDSTNPTGGDELQPGPAVRRPRTARGRLTRIRPSRAGSGGAVVGTH